MLETKYLPFQNYYLENHRYRIMRHCIVPPRSRPRSIQRILMQWDQGQQQSMKAKALLAIKGPISETLTVNLDNMPCQSSSCLRSHANTMVYSWIKILRWGWMCYCMYTMKAKKSSLKHCLHSIYSYFHSQFICRRTRIQFQLEQTWTNVWTINVCCP